MIRRHVWIFLIWGLLLSVETSAAMHSEGSQSADARCDRKTYRLFHRIPVECIDRIESDRPHHADTPNPVPAGYFQVETAILDYQYTRKRTQRPTEHQLLFGDTVIKAGLHHHADIQFGFSPLLWTRQNKMDQTAARSTVNTGTQLFTRMKVNLWGAHESLAVTIAPTMWIPLRDNARFEGGPTFMLGMALPLDISIEVNYSWFSMIHEDSRRHFLHAPSMAVTKTLANPVDVFVETSHELWQMSDPGWRSTLNTGVLYRFTPMIQMDLAAYIGLTRHTPPVYLTLGISVLL